MPFRLSCDCSKWWRGRQSLSREALLDLRFTPSACLWLFWVSKISSLLATEGLYTDCVLFYGFVNSTIMLAGCFKSSIIVGVAWGLADDMFVWRLAVRPRMEKKLWFHWNFLFQRVEKNDLMRNRMACHLWCTGYVNSVSSRTTSNSKS